MSARYGKPRRDDADHGPAQHVCCCRTCLLAYERTLSPPPDALKAVPTLVTGFAAETNTSESGEESRAAGATVGWCCMEETCLILFAQQVLT